MGGAAQMYPAPPADVAAGCALPLTRAVIQYRARHALEAGADCADDIGLGVVLDGEYATSAEALDLGSGRVRSLDLDAELVVLDWVYPDTLEQLRTLLYHGAEPATAALGEPSPELLRCSERIAFHVLRRVGFGGLIRPTLLRIGYRDVVRDLDPHERAAVRFAIAPGDVAAVYLHADHNALLVDRARGAARDPELERLLLQCFPDAELRPVGTVHRGHLLRLPLPLSLTELRVLVQRIRSGLLDLYAALEPDRSQAVRRALDVFGSRDTLARLRVWDDAPASLRTPRSGRPPWA